MIQSDFVITPTTKKMMKCITSSRRHTMIRSHLGRRSYSTLKQFRDEALERLQLTKLPQEHDWAIYTSPNLQAYIGIMKQFKGDGYGRLYQNKEEKDGSVTKQFEKGEFRDGLLYGLGHRSIQSHQGELEWNGEFKDGAFTGFGWSKWIRTDGSVIKREGEFTNDVSNGFVIYDGGDNIYYGDFVNGEKEGYGEWDTKSFVYKGYLKNDAIDGFGAGRTNKPHEMYLEVNSTKYAANGIGFCQYGESLGSRQYRGEFQNDQWHGYGVMTLATDSSFEWSGKWTNNDMESPGFQRNQSGTYCGDFNKTGFTGFGTVRNEEDNEIYYGEFKNYNSIGYGILENDNGQVVVINGQPVSQPTSEQVNMAELVMKRAKRQSQQGEANAFKARELASKLTFSKTLHPKDCTALKKEMEQHTKDLKKHYENKRDIQSLLNKLDVNMECVSDTWNNYIPLKYKEAEDVQLRVSSNHFILLQTETVLPHLHNFMMGDFLKSNFTLLKSDRSKLNPDLYNMKIMQYFYLYKDMFKENDSNLEELLLDTLGTTIKRLKKGEIEVKYMQKHLEEVFRQIHTRPNFYDMVSKLLQDQNEDILCVEDALIACHIPQSQLLLERQLARNGEIGTDNIKSLEALNTHIQDNPYVAPFDKVVLPNYLWAHYYASGNEKNLTAMINTFTDYYNLKLYLADKKIDRSTVLIEGFGHSTHWSMGTHMVYHSKIYEYCDQLVSHLNFKEANIQQLEVNSLLTGASIARKIMTSEHVYEEKILNLVSKLVQN
jgi:hypothetical protein